MTTPITDRLLRDLDLAYMARTKQQVDRMADEAFDRAASSFAKGKA
jgi:hypothetical protein